MEKFISLLTSPAVATAIVIFSTTSFLVGRWSASTLANSSKNKDVTNDSDENKDGKSKTKFDDTDTDTSQSLSTSNNKSLLNQVSESFSAFTSEPCKMVLVIRADLGMTKGKVVAQCAHATLACYKESVKSNSPFLKPWEYFGQAKITLKCQSEDELLTLQAMAQSLGITAQSIQDAGRTQVDPGTTTVLGIGPAPVSMVNEITGHLKLY